ncbi:MAG: glycosyltransferase family 2 protein [Candidatus Obscuribacterales bacterium]|nr:glycosyltransferase family 2 protein [Candidatus Obscuribacterales bacterium]
MTTLIFFLVETVLVIVLAGLTFTFFHYFRRLPAESLPEDELPNVTVLVPARNEESKIGRCLESLARQNYPRYEVIAIDDRSADRTGAIIQEIAARNPHVKYVRGTDTPPGWIGKCNALVSGVNYAKGEWYLFTDADTCHTPESLRYAVTYAQRNSADLISFMPVQELGSFWERVVMPVLLGSFLCGDPLNTINEHTNDRAYAYGQYILIRKSVYEACGGHASVHDQILDDISFARVVKSHGFHILSADGRLLYKVRMYTDLVSLWQGWTKNLFALIECRLLYLLTVIVLLNAAIVGPFISIFYVASLWQAGDISSQTCFLTSLLGFQITLLCAWYGRTAEHYTGVDLRHALLLPLGSLTVTVLYLHSAWLILSGKKVSWKGRRYTVHSDKAIDGQETPETTDLSGADAPPPSAVLDPALVKATSKKD